MDVEKSFELKRIKELENSLLDAKRAYYGLDPEYNFDEISYLDAQFDYLEKELRKLDPNNSVLQKVGSDFVKDKNDEVIHSIPMKSMDKIHTKSDVEKWFDEKLSILINDNMEIVVEPKIDGISGDLYYKDGKFMFASTRGNGKIGLRIDSSQIRDIPKNIPLKSEIHIRGEFHLPKEYNEKFPLEDQKCLRNVANGIISRKGEDSEKKEIRFIAYQLYGTNIRKETEKLDKIESMGFYTVPRVVLRYSEDLWNYFEKYNNSLRDVWEFETDGCCFIINDDKEKEKILKELGTTDHHEKWCVAIKPPAKGAWTSLREVEWATSKDGKVIPTGIISRIRIGDRFFERASLNNKSYIKLFDIEMNDKVYVISANDIIPHILHSKHTPQSCEIIIKNCPSCGTKLIEEGVHYYCPNVTGCPAQKINKFLHWFRMSGIKHVGESAMDSLINNGNISNLWELYAMKTEDLMIFVEKFIGIDKDSDTMKEFKTLFDKSRTLSEQEIIAYYGIPNFGPKTILEKKIKSLTDLEQCALKSSDKREQSLAAWLYKDDNLLNLRALIDKMNPSSVSNLQPTDDNLKTYCLTGKFEGGKRTIVELLKDFLPGWKYSDAFTKETKMLISGISDGNSNKIIKATSLGIMIISTKDGTLKTLKEKLKDIKI